MSKRQLEFLAVLLSFLIVVVLFAGLDDLPRSVRANIATEHQALSQAEKQFQGTRDEVMRDLKTEPDLFRTQAAVWPARLNQAESTLLTADKEIAELEKLRKENRRRDREQAERLLQKERSRRMSAMADASAIQGEANRWLDLKRNLPNHLQQIERDYMALHSADLATLGAAVQRAETDWPEKRADLESRLASVRSVPAEADKVWQSTEVTRRKAASNDLAGLDYAALFAAANTIKNANGSLPAKTQELKSLTGQLYDSWDKILVDQEVRRAGQSHDYDQKIRTVRTHLIDVAAKKSETSSEEQWVQVPSAAYEALEKNLGMAIEHKSAGKYDSEAERTAQPAGFAYIAPPAQGSNQYGYWEHRDGGSFWVFYGQYALMRDLLWGRNYTPLPPREYQDYRTAKRSGQTYYGRDESGGGPKYGSEGSSTRTHYADSQYVRGGGGYRDSQYASKSGTYRGSQYQSPAARSGKEEAAPRSFGSHAERPRSSGSSSYRPRSAPSRGAGRSFGRRR